MVPGVRPVLAAPWPRSSEGVPELSAARRFPCGCGASPKQTAAVMITRNAQTHRMMRMLLLRFWVRFCVDSVVLRLTPKGSSDPKELLPFPSSNRFLTGEVDLMTPSSSANQECFNLFVKCRNSSEKG